MKSTKLELLEKWERGEIDNYFTQAHLSTEFDEDLGYRYASEEISEKEFCNLAERQGISLYLNQSKDFEVQQTKDYLNSMSRHQHLLGSVMSTALGVIFGGLVHWALGLVFFITFLLWTNSLAVKSDWRGRKYWNHILPKI